MQETDEELTLLVRKALRDTSGPLWLPELTVVLADTAWGKLNDAFGLTRASYGTARVLCQDPREIRRVILSFETSSIEGMQTDAIPVELLPENLARRLVGQEVRFFGAEEILEGGVFKCVEQALKILGAVPTVLSTICTLVRALHLINPLDDEVDISFSDPGLPFSAFISVPGPGADASALRVAEALLHEAMHLQLTLVEAVFPLVRPTEKAYFSPWRNEYRTVQGVLHALYVFRVIEEFLKAALLECPVRSLSRSYASERRTAIARQVEEILDFRTCVDLTPDGAAFVDRLLG